MGAGHSTTDRVTFLPASSRSTFNFNKISGKGDSAIVPTLGWAVTPGVHQPDKPSFPVRARKTFSAGAAMVNSCKLPAISFIRQGTFANP